jgi:hypothetical protein
MDIGPIGDREGVFANGLRGVLREPHAAQQPP